MLQKHLPHCFILPSEREVRLDKDDDDSHNNTQNAELAQGRVVREVKNAGQYDE